MTNEDFLFLLYNKFGYTDLEVQRNYFDGENLSWSKRIRYEDLMSMSYKSFVKVGKHNWEKKKDFLNNISHRSILDIEILFDVDDSDWKGIPWFENILEKTKVCKNIFCLHHPVVSFTGNKSYHLSIIEPKLRDYSEVNRKYYKQDLLNKIGADLQLSSDSAMISMEGSKHYRSKKKKKMVSL
jgi:hypothetical protein